jgi:hypothetical protein
MHDWGWLFARSALKLRAKGSAVCCDNDEKYDDANEDRRKEAVRLLMVAGSLIVLPQFDDPDTLRHKKRRQSRSRSRSDIPSLGIYSVRLGERTWTKMPVSLTLESRLPGEVTMQKQLQTLWLFEIGRRGHQLDRNCDDWASHAG